MYKAIKSSIAAKQFGYEKILGYLVAEAALIVLPKNPLNFNVDNIRVVKILGGSLNESVVIKGMVFSREPEGTVRKVCSAKVGVFSCPLDISQTETKGVVLLKNAKEMLSFTKGEEVQLESVTITISFVALFNDYRWLKSFLILELRLLSLVVV